MNEIWYKGKWFRWKKNCSQSHLKCCLWACEEAEAVVLTLALLAQQAKCHFIAILNKLFLSSPTSCLNPVFSCVFWMPVYISLCFSSVGTFPLPLPVSLLPVFLHFPPFCLHSPLWPLSLLSAPPGGFRLYRVAELSGAHRRLSRKEPLLGQFQVPLGLHL